MKITTINTSPFVIRSFDFPKNLSVNEREVKALVRNNRVIWERSDKYSILSNDIISAASFGSILGLLLGFISLIFSFFSPGINLLLIGYPIVENLGLSGFASDLISSILTGLFLGTAIGVLTGLGLKDTEHLLSERG